MQRSTLSSRARVAPIAGAVLVVAALLGSTMPAQAALPRGAATQWTLLAAGDRASVLAVTTGSNTTNANGSEWYYQPGWSMGFAAGGDTIAPSTADIAGGPNDDKRLSWHLESTYMYGGYRLGSTRSLNGSTDYVRAIYEADTLPSYYPFGPQANVAATSLTGWTLCYLDLYNATKDLASLWSQCDGNFLLYAGGPVNDVGVLNVAIDGDSVLATPGGEQESPVSDGSDLDITAELDGSGIPWSHYVIYVSNCTGTACAAGSPLDAPDEWGDPIPSSGTFTVPADAVGHQLSIMFTDDATDAPYAGSEVRLDVTEAPLPEADKPAALAETGASLHWAAPVGALAMLILGVTLLRRRRTA